MPAELRFSPAEVCELFNVSKSTLFRWEKDGILEPPDRNALDVREPRVYTERDIKIIAERKENELWDQFRRTRRQMEGRKSRSGEPDKKRLKQMMELQSLRKFLGGDETGLAELAEYQHIEPNTVTLLLRLALHHYTPSDAAFAHLVGVAYIQSCRQSGEKPTLNQPVDTLLAKE